MWIWMWWAQVHLSDLQILKEDSELGGSRKEAERSAILHLCRPFHPRIWQTQMARMVPWREPDLLIDIHSTVHLFSFFDVPVHQSFDIHIHPDLLVILLSLYWHDSQILTALAACEIVRWYVKLYSLFYNNCKPMITCILTPCRMKTKRAILLFLSGPVYRTLTILLEAG